MEEDWTRGLANKAHNVYKGRRAAQGAQIQRAKEGKLAKEREHIHKNC